MRVRKLTAGFQWNSNLLTAVALGSWLVLAVAFSGLPEGSAGRAATAAGTYWVATAFAAVTLGYAILSTAGRCRQFWALIGAGLFFWALGDMSWAGSRLFGGADGGSVLGVTLQYAVYGLSLALFLVALIRLVSSITHRTTAVAVVDTMSIMLSVGLLLWYFFLGAAFGSATGPGESVGWWTATTALARPVFDAGLLFLALVVVSTRARPPFSLPLAGAFTVFLVGDVIYLRLLGGAYEVGNWLEPVWALGIVLLGLAALRSNETAEFLPQATISPWRVGSFWFGPLSPAMHFGFLLLWASFNPPVPAYVAAVGVILMFYFAFRISFIAYVSQELRRDQETLARRNEQSRISGELNDTLKRSVHDSAVLIAAYRNARENDPQTAESLLDRAVEAAREADRLVAVPIKELHALSGATTVDAETLFDLIREEVDQHFEIQVEERLESSPQELSTEQLAATYRIVSEALWNAARHSGARKVVLETHRVGSVFIVRVRDNGRGFPNQDPPLGIGMSMMRSRAENAGGNLDVISRPGEGTTVQVRFETR